MKFFHCKKNTPLLFNVKLSSLEENVVNAVYKHFIANTVWPSIIEIKHEEVIGGFKKFDDFFSKQTHETELVVKEGNILKLTFYGFLVCPAAAHDIKKLVINYIDLLHKDYIEYARRKITSDEIEKELNLDKEGSKRLSLIIMQVGGKYLYGGYESGENWKVSMPGEQYMDKIISLRPIEYLSAIIQDIQNNEKNYKKSLKHKIWKRMPRLWLSIILNLFLLAWILLLYHPDVLSNKSNIIFTGLIANIWFYLVIFSVAKIADPFMENKISRKVLDHWIWYIISFIITTAATVAVRKFIA